jgi:hypothetical protein
MNKTIKKYWVKALRSGLFRQARGVLEGVNEDGEIGYCCLGVLKTVCDKKLKKDPIGDELLSVQSLKLIGLTIEQQQKLSAMNDGDWNGTGAKSFDQIANYIEKHL